MNLDNLEIIGKLGEKMTVSGLKKGDKVRCISDDDYATRWGGNDSPKDYLTVGEVYTLVCDPEVHSWHTKLYLEEVPGKKFNSVQFKGVV